MRIMLTGAAGFVGSHVLRHLLQNTDHDLVLPVSFRHKGLPERIRLSCMASNPVDAHEYRHRVQIEMMDLSAPIDLFTARRIGPVDAILNVASDSHVDRSIERPESFILNNVNMMINLLEYARHVKPKIFLQMSTDEVYGPAPAGYAHKEWDAYLPSNPYSASKAAQESIAFSYWRTYGVPLVITNTMNIIGEMQDAEKFVPKIMNNVMAGTEMPIHVSPEGVPGSRFYLHARNLADAWLYLLNHFVDARGESWVPLFKHGTDRPEKFHIVGEREIDNVTMAKLVAEAMGKELLWKGVNFHESRPGHDLRYALDGSKLAGLGWKAPVSFEEALQRTVKWTLTNNAWLR